MDLDPTKSDPLNVEPSEHEPEEYDPEAELYDPESDGLTIPRVETSEADAPPELVRTFWLVTLTVNLAVFGVSFGVILVLFTDMIRPAIASFVGGVVLFGLAYRRYRAWDRRQRAEPRADIEAADAAHVERTDHAGETDATIDAPDAESDSNNAVGANDAVDATETVDLDTVEDGSHSIERDAGGES